MVNDIIALLKTGSIPDVVLYVENINLPSLPYVVVKPEVDEENETLRIRVIAHASHGANAMLEQYITVELTGLLKRKRINGYMERGRNEWINTVEDEDKNFITMERIFVFPCRLI